MSTTVATLGVSVSILDECLQLTRSSWWTIHTQIIVHMIVHHMSTRDVKTVTGTSTVQSDMSDLGTQDRPREMRVRIHFVQYQHNVRLDSPPRHHDSTAV